MKSNMATHMIIAMGNMCWPLLYSFIVCIDVDNNVAFLGIKCIMFSKLFILHLQSRNLLLGADAEDWKGLEVLGASAGGG